MSRYATRIKLVTLTVYSGSAGGVGKSTIAANLAAYLARRLQLPVMLVDLGVDKLHISSSLHGVDLAPNETSVVQAWLAALDGVAQPPQPAVKPSARADGVYVMPPGKITANEMAEIDAIGRDMNLARDAVVKLYSIIARQAVMYRTPLVIIDTPATRDVMNDLALAAGKMALLVLSPPSDIKQAFDGIMARAGHILDKRQVIVAVNKEVRPIEPISQYPEHHLPFSAELMWYTNEHKPFILYRPMTDPGRRWQAAFANLAGDVIKKAKELMGYNE